MIIFLFIFFLVVIPFFIDSDEPKTELERNEEFARQVDFERFELEDQIAASKSSNSSGISSRTLFFRVCITVCAAFGLLFLIAWSNFP